MSIAEDRFHPVDDATIDRLVDGDLDESDRRDLLVRLENEPDGWRRCALAFLEDQAWQRAIIGLGARPAAPPPVELTLRRGRRRGSFRVAIAASLVAATFAVGFAVGGASRVRSPVAVARSGPPDPVGPSTPDRAREIGTIALRDGSAVESSPGRAPIPAGPGLDEYSVRDRPPSIPDYVRASWERLGYQVDERRRLVSITLEDGRRVSIPIDEVELEYVGQQPL